MFNAKRTLTDLKGVGALGSFASSRAFRRGITARLTGCQWQETSLMYKLEAVLRRSRDRVS